MRRLAPFLSLVLLPLATGCGPLDALSGCHRADKVLVKRVMATARTNYEAGGPGGNRISHVELVRADVGDLPAKLRKFGMSEVLGLMADAKFADEGPGSTFGGVHLPTIFAVSADHERFLPVEGFSKDAFSVHDDAMRDPGFDAWAASVKKSDAGKGVRSCIAD